MTVWSILIDYHQAFLEGLAVTMRMASIVWVLGIVLGASLGVAGMKWRAVGRTTQVMSFIFSGVPMLVFLFWLHYPLQAMMEVVIDPFYTATAAFTIFNIVAVGDIIRGILNNFPQQYITAAKVCGMKERETFFHITLPLILREAIPPVLMLQVTMLHVTLFSSLISVEEIFRVAQRINATIYKPVEIYTALGIFFLMVCLPVTGFALWLKGRYTRDTSER